MKNNLQYLSAVELNRHFINGDVRAADIAAYFLKRIEQHTPALGAFLSAFPHRAIERAQEIDRKRSQDKPLGKLAGIPIAIKDNIHICNEITTCGSKFLSHYRAPFDATVVRLLEEEDAIILGKTNLDEFAMGSSNENSAFFPAKNPWDLECSPGGSSGGSAAAVSARLALISAGSDTGGSIRQPSSLCGIVGFKPTYGRVSRFGLVAFSSSLDQIGPLATTVADAGLAMEVIGRHCRRDATSLPFSPESYLDALDHINMNEITFGVPWHFLQDLADEPRTNFSQAIEVLKELGAKIIDIDLDICKYSLAIYCILSTAEASTNLARFDGVRFGQRSKEAKTLDNVYYLSRENGFGSEVKKRIMLGTYVLSAGFQDAYYKKAQKIRALLVHAFVQAFDTCDAVLLPTAPSSAFKLGSIQDPLQMYLQDIFTVPANLAELPAISVPSGFDRKGLPFGLQFVGPKFYDVPVMQYAHAYEKATLFTRKIPRSFEEP